MPQQGGPGTQPGLPCLVSVPREEREDEALAVWALWSASGAALAAALPQEWQARGAALQTVLIGVVLAAALLVRPRGLLGEETDVSPHARLE